MGCQFPEGTAYNLMMKPQKFFYGWVIVAISFLTLSLALGIRLSFGIFYVALLGEYGWGRGETAGAFSLAMVFHAVFAPVSGNLIDRFSPRKLFPLGATVLVIGLVTASRITDIWHLYLIFGVVMSIGINSIGFGPHMALIPRWFKQKRGLASGLVLSGMGTGAMALAPLTEFMIETVGWRSAFLILAGIIVGVVIPTTAVFQRRSPHEVGQHPDGIDPEFSKVFSPQPQDSGKDRRYPDHSKQWTFKAAFVTRAFWWKALAVTCHGFFLNMLLVHQAVYVMDAGYSQILAASLLGLVAFLGSVGGILFGLLSDRISREIGFTLGSCGAFLGVILLLFVRDTSSPWILYSFVILYGLGHGALGPIYAALLSDLFPGDSLGRIMSTLAIEFGIGGALGAYLGGYFYDQMGSYLLPFLLLLVSIGLGVLGIWMATLGHRHTSGKPIEGTNFKGMSPR